MKKQVNIKNKFRFGYYYRRRAYIFMRKNHSNFFFTLTDNIGRVVVCKTAAAVLGKLERRRRRKAPQTIEHMVSSLDKYLTLYNIRGVYLVLNVRPGQYVNSLIQSLKYRRIYLLKIFIRRKLPYSTTRGRRKKY